MGVTSIGRHTRPACTQDFTRSLKLCQECRFNSGVRVFFIPWRSRGSKPWFVTSKSHMVQILDSDWSRAILLRSDWLQPQVAMCTTLIWAWGKLTPINFRITAWCDCVVILSFSKHQNSVYLYSSMIRFVFILGCFVELKCNLRRTNWNLWL